MEWTNWNYINASLIFINAAVAYICFDDKENDRSFGGWVNVFASSINAAIVAERLL